MKRLLIVILVAAALWSGYWFVGAQGARSGVAAWFDARRAEGWTADYAGLSVAGFPNRFDTTLTDPVLGDPDTGWAWHAPFLQAFALSYRPTEVIAVFPHDQTVSTPFRRYSIESEDMRASIAVDAGPRLALDRATLVARQVTVSGTERSGFGVLNLATQRREGEAATYRYGLTIQNVSLPRPVLTRVRADTSEVPDVIARLGLDMDVTYDAPWDLDALEAARPQPRQITIRSADARWGDLELAAEGDLSVDSAGYPVGKLSIRAERWREMLQMAVAAGALPQATAASAEQGLGLLSGLTGGGTSLDVTLSFRDETTFLGPIPLGPAPLLRLR